MLKSKRLIIMNLKALFITITVIAISGCLRYTPSRTELGAGSSDQQRQLQIAGEAEFWEFTEHKKQRLAQFIETRKALNSNLSNNTYSIGVNDIIDIEVYDLPELNSSVRVRPDGQVTLPLIEDVYVAGLSRGELQNKLRKHYSPYVHHPRVKVAVAEFSAQKVSVIGAVDKPGIYSLQSDSTTVLGMISKAGGRTEKAGSRIVIIPSSSEADTQNALLTGVAKRQGVEFYMDELSEEESRANLLIPLTAGDTIIVPEVGTVQVDGDVKLPGSYPLSSKMSVMGAIAAARGLQYSANIEEIEVIRDIGAGKKAAIVLDLEKVAMQSTSDIRLHNGDVVRVPSSPGRFAQQQVVEFINGIFNVGVSASSP